ncbi:WecB/TagA/CpsF family glycosyltransferase [Flavivirga jejuensis]|uniref:WecB/TagA/CpsF family glycosyltransferase n=2 Tax=Flavivirga jejuensis TaxID=870487 RepID=A0ABT8WT99_9FLAO|nr:WecB/TagA/CpsF family glycosyltransferase [Flavivirga jejuensis]
MTPIVVKLFNLKSSINNSKNTPFKSIVELDLESVDLKTMGLRNILKNYIFSSDLKDIDLNKRQIINTINPHSYCVSKKDLSFKKALINSDVLLPDGFGIVLATKVLFGKHIKKIAGADIHAHLLKYANLNKKKVFYLGASQNTLKLITKRLKKEYPNIQVASYSPPYKLEFNSKDSKQMIDKVNTFNPDILFVGMTAPKQEKWVQINKHSLCPKTIVSIGAVFDFYAGTVKRSNSFWINLGLEWLPRLIKEPKRLWRRNFISTPLFLISLGKAKLNLS